LTLHGGVAGFEPDLLGPEGRKGEQWYYKRIGSVGRVWLLVTDSVPLPPVAASADGIRRFDNSWFPPYRDDGWN
jgi:hypothetical protein